jgi:hypothetical protein
MLSTVNAFMVTVLVRAMGAGAKATAEPTRAEARTVFIMMLGSWWRRVVVITNLCFAQRRECVVV